MQVVSVEPVYFCVDQGTGVALIRTEDRPPRGALIDFMRGPELVKPGAVIPLHWLQLWDYRRGIGEVPGLFSWSQFQEWLAAWPDVEAEYKIRWQREFGMPHDPLADGVIVVWEQRSTPLEQQSV